MWVDVKIISLILSYIIRDRIRYSYWTFRKILSHYLYLHVFTRPDIFVFVDINGNS